MGLSTLTFDELRQRNERSLDRAGYFLPAEEITREQRTEIDTILNDRIAIEDMASTQPQRERYGIERWHSEFVRLRDIPAEERMAVWNSVPNCRFKRFQELFCHQENYTVPRYVWQGRTLQFTQSHFNHMSLRPCLVSPDMIPEKLAEDLHLCDFTADNGNTRARLEKKHDITERLKLIFESAVQLQPGNHRLLRIEAPRSELQEQYGDTPGPDDNLHGTLLYSRENSNGNGYRPRVVQHFRSAYAALRKTTYESRTYSQELYQLHLLRNDLQALIHTLDTEWTADALPEDKQRLFAEANTLLQQATELLERCVHQYKIQAFEKIDAAQQLRDSRGVINPSASMSKMVAAIDRLDRRIIETPHRSSYNEQDRLVLEQEIRSGEEAFRSQRTHLREQAGVLSGNTALFSNAELSNPQVQSNARGIQARLLPHSHRLQQILLQPLRGFARRSASTADQLQQTLQAQDRSSAMLAATTLDSIGREQAVCTYAAHMKSLLIDSDQLPLARLLRYTIEIQQQLSAESLYTDIAMPGYSALQDHISQIFLLLQGDLPSEDVARQQYCQTIRQHLDTLTEISTN